MSDLLFRDAVLELREETAEAWTVSGLAVPYGVPTSVGDYREQFAPGAFSDGVTDGTQLFYGHNHQRGEAPIGKITEHAEDESGLSITARISKTVRGTEIYQLLKDGVLTKFSVGFKPGEHREEDGVTIRTKATLVEVSIVPMPAYAGAQISEVRSENNEKEATMAEDFKADLVEVRNAQEEMSRQIEVLKVRDSAEDSVAIRFGSLGEFVKGLGDKSVTREDAEALTRAYTGAQTSDNGAQVPTWVKRDVKLVAQNRNVLELFSKEPLPAQGMTVNYPTFGSTSGDVAVQATEGADLAYLELITGNGSAPVTTYGGYSSLSRQVIERNDASYLNKVLQFQKLSYAKVTNGAVRTLLSNTPTAYNQGTVAFASGGQALAKNWVDAALAGSNAIATNSVGLSADVWLMPFAVFQKLASIYDTTNRPVFALNGDGANTAGSVDIRGVKANVAGLPVVVDNNLTGTDTFIVSREAISVMESGPFNLNDENVINLTKDFSIYGYLALTKNDVKGITRISVPAV